ncbi:hypothetical protein K435DRAFT_851402 [Dendrothele bispora CBS 962.96]|uniref:Uncharacterized protein n=1 Tax=Dendrothele bispora (strain CBS 962.96) TaxID=1314807 RepID=A0A4S8MNB8_DENBC|nr:hypothetical protein K435DRAFT_851402 [Dendrothele bispora CBS 962.96]
MRSFTPFLILLLCMFEASHALPAPARKGGAARPAPKVPARPPAPAPAAPAKPQTTKASPPPPPPTTRATTSAVQATTSSTPQAVTSSSVQVTTSSTVQAATSSTTQVVTSSSVQITTSSAAQAVTSSSSSAVVSSSTVQPAISSSVVTSSTTQVVASSSVVTSSTLQAITSSALPSASSSIQVTSSSQAVLSSQLSSSSAPISSSSATASQTDTSSSQAVLSSQLSSSAPLSSSSATASQTNTSSSAQPSASSQALSCPLPSKSSTSTAATNKPKRSFFEGFISLFRRAGGAEFVGWHGTNGINACEYTRVGRSGGGLPVLTEFNGADAELGAGLYVTDDIDTARFFAISSASARRNRGQSAQASLATVCKVEAIDQSTWRDTISKFWIPFTGLARPIPGQGNNPAALAQQEQLITGAGQTPGNTVRFSALNPQTTGSINQMAIPTSQFQNFRITECLPTSQNDPTLITKFTGISATNENSFTHPGFDYQNFRQVVNGPWNILGDQL